MKLTNEEIFHANKPLRVILEKELPVSISYELVKMANKLAEQFKIIDEVRSGLVRKYGTEKDGKVKVEENSKNAEKFMAEYNELMSQEVELVIQKVTLPKEVDGKPLKIKPITLMALEKLVGV